MVLTTGGQTRPYHLNIQVTSGDYWSTADQPSLAVPGTKPNGRGTTRTAPKHLIGDPPLPSSFQDLQGLDAHNTSTGNSRRPGSRPSVPAVTHPPPHHLIGDPPTWPDDPGTYLFSTTDPGDDRPLLPGEVNLYIGPLNAMGGSMPFYSQMVVNWNPTTGIVRVISWQSASHPPDPSNVDYYYYTPEPPTPPPAASTPTPAPTPINTASVPPSPVAPQIIVGASPVNLPSQAISSAVAGVPISPLTGTDGSAQVSADSAPVTNNPPANAGTSNVGQPITLSSLTPEDFTDDGSSESQPPSPSVAALIPDISPVSALTVAEALATPAIGVTGAPAPVAVAAPLDAPASQVPAQQGDEVAETNPPITQASPDVAPGDMPVAATDAGAQGAGSDVPWGVMALALLTAGTAAYASYRAMSNSSVPGLSEQLSQQQVSDDEGVAEAAVSQEIQSDQESIQNETRAMQQVTQDAQQSTLKLASLEQQTQTDMQAVQEDKAQITEDESQGAWMICRRGVNPTGCTKLFR